MVSFGKVFLVGAGPGHPDLLTIKARDLLMRADAVVYDRLIQEEMLAVCRPYAERVYVGKAPGRHESRQSEINDQLVALARRHALVVRLKGGDPLLFGRGGEEAEHLAAHGVPCEIVPGVTSALAAPAAAGIPVTHRDIASSVVVVTGHEKDGAAEGRIDWGAIARIDTVVILMAVHALERVSRRLIAAGRPAETPAALVQTAYWSNERVVEATLGTIAAAAEREGVRPPATLVIGDVVRARAALGRSERELLPSPGSTGAAPGPSPAALFRMIEGARATRHLASALSLGLFDLLEEPRSPAWLARALGAEPARVAALCHALVEARLLVGRDRTFRNTELASGYLRTTSPGYRGELLLAEITALASPDRRRASRRPRWTRARAATGIPATHE